MRQSELLTADALQSMIAGGEVLEQDERGYKVIKLQSGDILKIFRVRRKISGARIYSHARRFMRNAERLQKLGVNTVVCKQLYHFDDSTDSAVLYAPLAGYTLKQLLQAQLLNQDMARALGVFIARLHQLGIHFRSLHMGNILVMPDGQYGLIDISDMNIYPWPLFCNTRVRNFRHLCRYPEDIQRLGKINWESMLEGYFSESNISHNCEFKILSYVSHKIEFVL